MFEIGQISGYKMWYDQHRRVFVLKDEEGDSVAEAPMQTELEEKAKKLSKAALQFPIRVIKIWGATAYPGRITSYNLDAKEGWFVSDKESREKISFQWERAVFEENGVNLDLCEKLAKLNRTNEIIDGKIRELISTFTGKIDHQYFKEKVKEGSDEASDL